MPYEYENFREFVLSDEGQIACFKAKEALDKMFAFSGAATVGHLCAAIGIADSWKQLAIIDRLVELKLVKYIGPMSMRQDWVIVPIDHPVS